MREWIDEQTGRAVRQLTHSPDGASVRSYRRPRGLRDGRVLGHVRGPGGGPVAIDPASGDVELLHVPARVLRPSYTGDSLFCWDATGGELWSVELEDGKAVTLGHAPRVGPHVCETDISEDGRTVVMGERIQDLRVHPTPDDWNAERLMRWFERPRSGNIWACDVASGRAENILHLDDLCPIHVDPCPTDPGLIKFSHDRYDAYCQRIWTVRSDGTQLRPIRRQQRGELVTHEFWWPDGRRIGYKYQDRRSDDTIERLPWAEYAPVPTQLGLATLDGEERYLSDPLNHYHSHIGVSRDGSLLCGEGTDGRSFVYGATFSMASTRIDFVPLATVHTQYRPFSVGHGANAGFSPNGRWLLYNDTVENTMQICAVRVDL